MLDGTQPAPVRRYLWERVLKKSAAGQTTRLVGLMLATYTNRDGTNAHPGVERLREDCQLGSDKTVRTHLAKLVDLGLIHRTFEAKASGRRDLADVYVLTKPAESVVVPEPREAVETTGNSIKSAPEPPVSGSPQERSTYRAPEHPTNEVIDHHSAKRSLPASTRNGDRPIDPDDYEDEHEWLRDTLSSEFDRDLAPDEEAVLYNWAAEGVNLKVIENKIRKLAREKPPQPRVTRENYADLVMASSCPRCKAQPRSQCVGLGWGAAHEERFKHAGVPAHFAA